MRQYNISPATTWSLSLLILSLDTSTREGSVAVIRDHGVAVEITGDASRTHGQRLPGDLLRALRQAGARLEDVDLLAVAAGPGSFTGLRVGIATMQGVAMSRGLRLVPVSTLEALAREAVEHEPSDALIAPWIDAQRGEVFAVLYAPSLAQVLMPPSSLPPRETLASWVSAVESKHIVFAGDGAGRYRDAIASALGERARIRQSPSLAGIVGRIAAREPYRAVLPHAVIPMYIRRPDAELARERSAAQ